MFCTVVLTYTLVFVSGESLQFKKNLDDRTAKWFTARLHDSSFLEKNGIVEVRHIRAKHKAPFNCNREQE